RASRALWRDIRAGNADDLAAARRRRLAWEQAAQDRLWRGDAAAHARERAHVVRSVALAYVRADRDDRLVVGAPSRVGRGCAAAWGADRQYALLHPRRSPAAGSGRGSRRAVH